MENPSAIITGASEGIGAGMARAFARKGFRLGLMARRAALLESVAEDCLRLGASRVEIASVDVTESAAFRGRLRELDDRLGGAGAFVANAGMGGEFRPGEDAGERIRKMVALNVSATLDGIECMKTRMIERRGGTIAAVTSIAAARGLPLLGAYSATKAAIATYLESLRIELMARGVRVVEIAPGFVDTALTRANRAPKPFMIHPDLAGEVFVRDLLLGKARSIAPWPYRPIYSLLRLVPHRLYCWAGARSAAQLAERVFLPE